MTSSESLVNDSLKGFSVLLGFALLSITANIGLNYFWGVEVSTEQLTVAGLLIFAALPGSYFLGRAISTQIVISSEYEKKETSEETIQTAENRLNELTESLEKKGIILTEAVETLSFFRQKIRFQIFLVLSGLAIGSVITILAVTLLTSIGGL